MSNIDVLQLGYGSSTGLRVRDPSTNQMLELASMMFGAQSYVSTTNMTPPQANNTSLSWSAWRYYPSIGSITTPTGRLLLVVSAHYDVAMLGDSDLYKTIQLQVSLTNKAVTTTTDTKLPADTTAWTTSPITMQNGQEQGVDIYAALPDCTLMQTLTVPANTQLYITPTVRSHSSKTVGVKPCNKLTVYTAPI